MDQRGDLVILKKKCVGYVAGPENVLMHGQSSACSWGTEDSSIRPITGEFRLWSSFGITQSAVKLAVKCPACFSIFQLKTRAETLPARPSTHRAFRRTPVSLVYSVQGVAHLPFSSIMYVRLPEREQFRETLADSQTRPRRPHRGLPAWRATRLDRTTPRPGRTSSVSPASPLIGSVDSAMLSMDDGRLLRCKPVFGAMPWALHRTGFIPATRDV
jgi:hypothetical protein